MDKFSDFVGFIVSYRGLSAFLDSPFNLLASFCVLAGTDSTTTLRHCTLEQNNSTNLSRKMSTSSFGGTIWKWYLFSSCSLGLRERGYGTSTWTVSATCCQFFFRYVHLNYASWGSVYISEMNQLPKQGLEKVQEGERCFKFNQVSPDHSLELLDRLGIRSGRIVGTTNTSSALSRWALSYNRRPQIAEHTPAMFRLHQEQEDKFSLNESTSGRKDRVNKDE